MASVRSSVARRQGLQQAGMPPAAPYAEGLVEVLLDATRNYEALLSLERLLGWHRTLFPSGRSALREIRVGELRGPEPMQVITGVYGRERMHFEAPPRDGLERQLARFLEWFEASRWDAGMDGLLRAGLAHFHFVTPHPFDDGNGRLARALTDLALARHSTWAGFFLGAGGFPLFDGIVNHKLPRTHQIRYGVDLLPCDLAWNGLALVLIIVGWLLLRRAWRTGAA